MITTIINCFKIRSFNNYGDSLKTPFGIIRFKGYRCVGGEYHKTYSVAKSKKIANCGGYCLKGLVVRFIFK